MSRGKATLPKNNQMKLDCWGRSTYLEDYKKNQVINWLPMDTEELYQKHLTKTNSKKLLEKFGWIDYDITYSFNEHGYRSDSFEHNCQILFNGCSQTVGIGLPLDAMWSKQVADYFNVPHHNIATGGSDWQYATQRTTMWVPKLKPSILVIKEPPAGRLNWWIDERKVVSSSDFNHPESVSMMKHHINLIADETNQEWYRYSMMELTKKICYDNNCDLIIIPSGRLTEDSLPSGKQDLARDLAHHGRIEQDYIKEVVIKKISEYNYGN